MFIEGTWIVRSCTNPAFSLDCTPERLEANIWCPQLTVYRDGADGVMAHTVVAKALVFETQLEAAQAARMYGERWIAQHLRS
jgi:hypothetical protein